METLAPSRLLRLGLIVDAVGTAGVALLQLGGGDALARVTGVPGGVLSATGFFLVAYVVLLAVLAVRPRLPVALVRFIVAGNAAWALAALVAGVDAGWPLTARGEALVGVHVVAVLGFAVLQYVGMRRSAIVAGARAVVPA